MPRIRDYLCVCSVLSALVGAAAFADDRETLEKKDSSADIAGRVGDSTITMQEVDAKALSTNMKLAQSLYEARLAAIDEIVLERALAREAADQGKSVDDLISQKVAENVQPITDEAVQAYYDANSARMRGKKLEQVSEQIRNFLASKSEKTARKKLLADIKKSANVRILLEPPRVDVVVAANDPFRGAPDAKVTIVEFVDFQ